MRPLRVHIDVTHGTATPAQPDPQTVHLNAAQSRQQPSGKNGLPTTEAACPPQNLQQRKKMPLQGAEISVTETAPTPQSQPQRMEMPLLDSDSPDMGAAFPPEFSQQRMEMPLPGINSSTVGAANPSRSQPQRREMPLPEMQKLTPPTVESSLPSASATTLPGEPTPNVPFPPVPPCVAMPHTANRTLLLHASAIPSETARLVRCHNPWPTVDVLFCPEDALPAFVTGIPALSSGPELWIAVHNHRPEPLQLQSGQNIGVLEVVTLADAPPMASQPGPPRRPSLPERLSLLQQQQLNALFQEFSDVSSQGEDDLGSTPLLEHTIETHGPPLRQPYRLQNPVVRREEMAQVQQMLASNVICPSNSLWASPVVMVRKKDGSLYFCVDFRQLNVATIKDAHPLPRIDDLLDALHGAKWFSTIDLKSGYWQVPITEQDKAKTTFRTSGGQLYEFNQVPFGLCNAPATFSRLLDRVLASLHWEMCLFYLDDIIVFSSTWEEHLARLRQVFELLRHANLKLGADKCTFAAKEVSYLGHRVTEECLLPDSSLLAAIREIPPPKTATEVRSFLGLAGYYRRYVKGFAAIAGPLHALTRKDAVFHWSAECQAAFDQLKHLLTTSPSLPSRTLARSSAYTPTPPPQASVLF